MILKKERPWFAYCPENGFAFFATRAEAEDCAEDFIEGWKDTNDEWGEEVEGVFFGRLDSIATAVDKQKRPDELDEEGCDGEGVYWHPDFDFMCNYKLIPIDDQDVINRITKLRAKMEKLEKDALRYKKISCIINAGYDSWFYNDLLNMINNEERNIDEWIDEWDIMFKNSGDNV